ncbi:hypothetical protein DXG01_003245 [Tephrocybe rancida]|nr:hypothetical protein DXG01_003245 [Tephrocybe rancida]
MSPIRGRRNFEALCKMQECQVHKKGCYHSAKYLESLERSERTGAVDNLLPPGISLSELNTCFDKWNKYHNPTLCAALIRALDLPRDINRSRTHILKINIEARTDPEVHDAGKYFHVVDAEVLDAAVARTLPGWAVPMEELDTLRADSEQKGWGAFIGVALQCPALGLVFATFTSISQRDIKYFKLRALPDWKDRLISDVEKGRRRSVLDNT